MIQHLIDGESVDSADRFETISPATQEPICEVAAGGEREVALAVDAAKAAFPKWAGLPAKTRAKVMRKLGELIEANVAEIAAMETEDTGPADRPDFPRPDPARRRQLPLLRRGRHPHGRACYPVDRAMLNYTLYQPVGVCGLISPWNVPFMTATWKVAPCLALGNTAVLKMSELSPLSADRLGRLALEAGVPKGVLNIVHGYGRTAGEALVRHPDVRTISFTGGTVTGEHIAHTAGIKKLSLELGGKSPVLVFEDADLERALDAALFTIFSITHLELHALNILSVPLKMLDHPRIWYK
ncbi:MAG: aldehyde dehydrogenase family protein [Caulobacteraceae bacterium]